MLDLYVQLKRVKLDSGNTLLVFQKLSNALPALWYIWVKFLFFFASSCSTDALFLIFSNSLSLWLACPSVLTNIRDLPSWFRDLMIGHFCPIVGQNASYVKTWADIQGVRMSGHAGCPHRKIKLNKINLLLICPFLFFENLKATPKFKTTKVAPSLRSGIFGVKVRVSDREAAWPLRQKFPFTLVSGGWFHEVRPTTCKSYFLKFMTITITSIIILAISSVSFI